MTPAAEEKPPDTVPVPTPPLESGARNPDITIVRKPFEKRKPPKAAMSTVDEMLIEIEKKNGVVSPESTMLVLRAYRSLEATHRALKEVMAKHVQELSTLKAKPKKEKKR